MVKIILVLGILMFLIGVGIYFDQYRIHQQIYEFKDINNHETVGLIFLSSGISFTISYLINKKKKETWGRKIK